MNDLSKSFLENLQQQEMAFEAVLVNNRFFEHLRSEKPGFQGIVSKMRG